MMISPLWGRPCVVFSLGGMADPPHEEPNESRHITRMNHAYDSAKKIGCKVFKAHNVNFDELMSQMKEFVKNEGIDSSYKFHFSFSDHGSGSKIPLSHDDYIKPEKFFEGISNFIPANAVVTYASHICWGGNLAKPIFHSKLNYNLCGGSSVDDENLSQALNNPIFAPNQKREDFFKKKYETREQEYLGAGWAEAVKRNQPYLGLIPQKSEMSIFEYHYQAIKVDTTNTSRGASLSSLMFIRSKKPSDEARLDFSKIFFLVIKRMVFI